MPKKIEHKDSEKEKKKPITEKVTKSKDSGAGGGKRAKADIHKADTSVHHHILKHGKKAGK